jgi:hypothetical protein
MVFRDSLLFFLEPDNVLLETLHCLGIGFWYVGAVAPALGDRSGQLSLQVFDRFLVLLLDGIDISDDVWQRQLPESDVIGQTRVVPEGVGQLLFELVR